MDKAQKELITTYFRKRKIANEEYFDYTSHEIIYFLDNNVNVNLKGLDFTEIVKILEKRPDLINKFDLSKLNGDYIAMILAKQPKLIDRFDLSKLDGYDIGYILEAQPQLVDGFDLSKLEIYQIIHLLEKQPDLIDAVGLNNSRLDISGFFGLYSYRIKSLIEKHPQLAKYFNKQ